MNEQIKPHESLETKTTNLSVESIRGLCSAAVNDPNPRSQVEQKGNYKLDVLLQPGLYGNTYR